MNLTALVIPLIVVFVLVVSAFKKINIMEEFSKGGIEGLETAKRLVPTLALFLTAISVLKASGLLEALTALLSEGAKAVGIPSEVLPLVFLKPFSSGGSVAIMEDIFKTHGPDSFVGRVAAVIAGSTETTFYTISLYFGSVGVLKTRHTVVSSLTSDITGFILSAFLVKMLF